MKALWALILLAGIPGSGWAQTVRVEGKDGTVTTMPAELPPIDKRVNDAARLIKSGQFAEALLPLDTVIAEFERMYPEKPDTRYYSTDSMPLALLYSAFPVPEKSRFIIDGSYALAYFLRGFALIDLKRPEEARPFFDKALSLSPMDSQFHAELGEWHKSKRDWPNAYESFETAASAADLGDEDVKVARKGRALRGMAFVLIEQGKMKKAEEMLKRALELNPDDQKAKSELQYIKDHR